MTPPNESATRPTTAGRLVRRVAAVSLLSGLVFMLLWLFIFSAFTSLMIASAFCVVVVAAGAALDPVDMVLEAISAIVFVVLGAIAAAFAAIFSLFGF